MARGEARRRARATRAPSRPGGGGGRALGGGDDASRLRPRRRRGSASACAEGGDGAPTAACAAAAAPSESQPGSETLKVGRRTLASWWTARRLRSAAPCALAFRARSVSATVASSACMGRDAGAASTRDARTSCSWLTVERVRLRTQAARSGESMHARRGAGSRTSAAPPAISAVYTMRQPNSRKPARCVHTFIVSLCQTKRERRDCVKVRLCRRYPESTPWYTNCGALSPRDSMASFRVPRRTNIGERGDALTSASAAAPGRAPFEDDDEGTCGAGSPGTASSVPAAGCLTPRRRIRGASPRLGKRSSPAANLAASGRRSSTRPQSHWSAHVRARRI